MNLRRMCGTLVLMVSFGGTVSMAWASETGAVRDVKGGAGQEAVVVAVDGDMVTLRSLADGNRIFTLSRKDAGPLQPGDKVALDGKSVKKLGNTPDPVSKPGSGDASADMPASGAQQPTLPAKPGE